MAEQDFKINIVTLADLTGIRLTQQQLDALQTAAKKGNQEAIGALRQLAAAQKQAQSAMTAGFTGSAIGIGTIVSLLTGAISKWKAFNDEQDRMVEKMIQAQEKTRALGESIIGIQDEMISLRRTATEPLEDSLTRLQHDLAVLKTEQSLLNLPSQGDEWKRLNGEISKTEGQINRVTSALERQKDQSDKAAEAADKAARKRGQDEQSFIKGAVATADPNVQRVLQNEEAARRAQAAGRGIDADMFTRSAEAFKRGLGPSQLEELAGLETAVQQMNTTLGQILEEFR